MEPPIFQCIQDLGNQQYLCILCEQNISGTKVNLDQHLNGSTHLRKQNDLLRGQTTSSRTGWVVGPSVPPLAAALARTRPSSVPGQDPYLAAKLPPDVDVLCDIVTKVLLNRNGEWIDTSDLARQVLKTLPETYNKDNVNKSSVNRALGRLQKRTPNGIHERYPNNRREVRIVEGTPSGVDKSLVLDVLQQAPSKTTAREWLTAAMHDGRGAPVPKKPESTPVVFLRDMLQHAPDRMSVREWLDRVLPEEKRNTQAPIPDRLWVPYPQDASYSERPVRTPPSLPKTDLTPKRKSDPVSSSLQAEPTLEHKSDPALASLQDWRAKLKQTELMRVEGVLLPHIPMLVEMVSKASEKHLETLHRWWTDPTTHTQDGGDSFRLQAAILLVHPQEALLAALQDEWKAVRENVVRHVVTRLGIAQVEPDCWPSVLYQLPASIRRFETLYVCTACPGTKSLGFSLQNAQIHQCSPKTGL